VVQDWSGVYFGAHGGYGWGRMRWSENQALDTAFADDTFAGEGPNHGLKGAVAGGHLGIQYQWGWLVYGIEFAGAWANLQGKSCCEFGARDDTYTSSVQSIYQAVGRLGFASGPWHGYVKGGYAGGRVGIELVDNSGLPTSGRDRQWINGFTVGGGLEWAVTPYVILGVDYSYIQFSERDYTLSLIGDGSVTYRVAGPSVQVVVGRVSYKFNPPALWP
jgi:outer membrane immunogenic protein